jgi:hypothetical protein
VNGGDYERIEEGSLNGLRFKKIEGRDVGKNPTHGRVT